MDKVLKIALGNSKEEVRLYNWLITHENMEDLIKKILIKEMDIGLDEKTTAKPSFNSKDLQKLFDDDSFWD